ncbi:MAG: RNA-directed DNA polymerase, partial [Oscillospiraceae bacterium]|nr:RNA-directed DNA polymerase [Oscillospiraceae bacterium]
HKAIDRLQYWLKQTDRKPKKYYYLKLDVSKYFYRIDHGILKKILAKMIDDPPLLDLMAKIIDCEDTKFGLPLGADIGDVAFDRMLDDVGLPIGNLTSQMFANLYLNELDQFCKHKLRLHFYIRYMDDIIILHDDKKYLEKVKQDIAVFLGKKLNLQLNKKTCIRPTSMGIEFVGFRVWATHRKLRKKTAKKLKRRLQYMFHAYKIGEIDKDTLDRSVASYRGILKHFESYGLRKSLNEMYKKEVCGNVTGAIADSERDSGVACGGRDNN